MTAPKTQPVGTALEAPAFRGDALWMLAAPLGLTCLPGLAVGSLPAPQTPMTVGILVMVLMGVAAEIAAVARPIGPFKDIFFPAEALLVFGLAFASPAALLIGRVGVSAASDLLHRRHPAKVVFNAAVAGAETLSALALYRIMLNGGEVNSVLGVGAAIGAVIVATAIGLSLMAAVHVLHGNRVPRREVNTMVALALGGLVLGLVLVLGLSALAG